MMEKVARATLRYLFQEYLKGPAVPYTINAITRSFRRNAIDVSDYLLDHNWIRERWICANDTVSCRITVAGIEEVNPSYISTKLRQIIEGLADAGGSRDLMEIFQNRISEYVVALDIVNQLEKLEMARLHHIRGCIYVELTDYGWQHFSRKKKPGFSMLAVA